MILRQYLHDEPTIAAWYLFGCGSRAAGAVVDPIEAPDLYLEEASGVHDGEKLELGNTIIEVLLTPGHTPEHVSLLVTDGARSDVPWLVLTGHTLNQSRRSASGGGRCGSVT